MQGIVQASLGSHSTFLQQWPSAVIPVLQVDGEFMAAVLLRRRQPPSSAGSAQSPEAKPHPDNFAALELAALWVDPTLEDRAEVTCCLLVYLQLYLLAWDPVSELHAGEHCNILQHLR